MKMTPKKMAKLLSEKLTKEEYYCLATLIDEDPFAGPFWEAIQDINLKLNPEAYSPSEGISKIKTET